MGQNNNLPVLLLGTAGFGAYTGEIIKAEGYNGFDIVSSFRDETVSLQEYEVVILGADPPVSWMTRLETYVREGGGLISFRPGDAWAFLFDLTPCAGVIEDAYIKINTGTKIGRGLRTETLQFHGEAGLYRQKGGEEIASLYRDTETPAGFPALVVNRYGLGQAAAFTYHLPQSIVYTRQGNPVLSGQETDGIPGIRGMDLFGEGWLDISRNHLNQADEQMSLLSRCLEHLSASMPLPRFWYFPGGRDSLVILTNDGENSTETQLEPQFAEVEAKGARMSLYVKELDLVSPEQVKKWVAAGHEIAGHPDDTEEATAPTWNRMEKVCGAMVEAIHRQYGLVMQTCVNHWFVWVGQGQDGTPDFAAQAKIGEKYGLKMDLNYGHYDNGAIPGHSLGPAGNFTGSGLPMRFADAQGDIIDVFQVLTNVYDQQYMEKNDPEGFFYCFKTIIDRSLSGEAYSLIGLKAHNDEWPWSKEPVLRMLDYANEKEIPVWTAAEALDFIMRRDGSVFRDIRWSGGCLSFIVQLPTPGAGLVVLLPCLWRGDHLIRVKIDGVESGFVSKPVKGVRYDFLKVEGGTEFQVEAFYKAKKEGEETEIDTGGIQNERSERP